MAAPLLAIDAPGKIVLDPAVVVAFAGYDAAEALDAGSVGRFLIRALVALAFRSHASAPVRRTYR